jgi:hypothetical protein
MNRVHLILAALALAACNSTKSRPPAHFQGPAAVAVARAYTLYNPTELRSYAAVANTRSDDLKLIDGLDSQVVLAPAPVGALSIPTDSRPSLLAAASLNDVDGTGTALARPDLLVVGFEGLVTTSQVSSARLEVVDTWDVATRVSLEIDLAEAPLSLPGAEVVALAAAPIAVLATGTGVTTPAVYATAPGRARLFVALTGGRLATIDFTRATDSSGAPTDAIVLDPASPPTLQTLGFEPLSLAFEPNDPTRLYIATTDPLPGGIFGVAELDVTQSPFAVRPLSAILPTIGVAALRYQEFSGFTSDPSQDTFGASQVLRIFALPKPGTCGRDAKVSCGLLVIDPVTATLAADPAGQAPFFTPIALPGQGLSITAVPLSKKPAAAGLMQIAPGTGQRYTTGLLLVPSSAGRIYMVDPAHWAVSSDTSLLDGDLRAHVLATQSTLPLTAAGLNQPVAVPLIGLWNETFTAQATTVVPGANALSYPVVTPGYTTSELWTVEFQGSLPGLAARPAQMHSLGTLATGGGVTWVAIQTATGLPDPLALRGIGRLYDIRLGLHVGDIIEVDPTGDPAGALACPKGPFELYVSDILPPSAVSPPGVFPGGAAQVSSANAPSTQPSWYKDVNGNWVADPNRAVVADPTCLDAVAGDYAVLVTFRARRFLLSGNVSGYSGRPEFISGPPNDANGHPVPPGPLVAASPPTELVYTDERTISCPILGDGPDDWPPSATAVATCQADPACRGNCERLLIARHSRRVTYVTDKCLPLPGTGATGSTSSTCLGYWPPALYGFPNPTGPVLSFKLGLVTQDGTIITDDTATTVRGAQLQISTLSGLAPASRSPYTASISAGAILPTGVALFDKANTTGVTTDGFRAYGTFAEDLVLDFSPDDSSQNATVHR